VWKEVFVDDLLGDVDTAQSGNRSNLEISNDDVDGDVRKVEKETTFGNTTVFAV
jgi:hypothetical protein